MAKKKTYKRTSQFYHDGSPMFSTITRNQMPYLIRIQTQCFRFYSVNKLTEVFHSFPDPPPCRCSSSAGRLRKPEANTDKQEANPKERRRNVEV